MIELGRIEVPDFATAGLAEASRRMDAIEMGRTSFTDLWDQDGAEWRLSVQTDWITVNDEGPGRRTILPGMTRASLTITKDDAAWELERSTTEDWLVLRYSWKRREC